ncbi:MAG: hypothetical protein A3J38_05675 [Gammaproteobacteria bacterium RIFCSPHIGHO2_12_FULL_45_9]|nr:MAG: hypothetical protein A3J38_05675 [Gammaproteobacteria bacterium RIFCSPHIGHO2_12_FULL_45_9]
MNFQDFSRKLQLKSLDGSIVENPHLLSAALMNHGPLMCILDFDQDHGSSGILHFINIFGIVQCNARPEVLVIENKAQYYQNSPTEFRLRIPHEVLYRNLLRFDDIWLSRDDFTTPTFDCEGNLISSKYKIPADGAIQIRKKVPPIWYIEGAAEVLVRKKLCVVGENANQLTKTLLPMPRYPTYPSTDP